MAKKFPMIGFILFLLSIIPLLAFMTSWWSALIEVFNRVTIFIPIACGVAGLVVSLMKVKGWTKSWLIAANLLSICGWAFLLFVAIFGFQAP